MLAWQHKRRYSKCQQHLAEAIGERIAHALLALYLDLCHQVCSILPDGDGRLPVIEGPVKGILVVLKQFQSLDVV
jgi:hypothetical protein